MNDLDNLIDRYLIAERRDLPRLGYPSKAAGTAMFRSSRQWDSSNVTLEEAASSAELVAMEGAWASLSFDEERFIRADAAWRTANVPRPPGYEDGVFKARARLARLLVNRGFYLST